MRKLVIVIIAIYFILFSAIGYTADESPISMFKYCPKTTMARDCLICHVVSSFAVRETAPDAHLVYPFDGMKVVMEGNILKGYYLLTGINSVEISKFFDYLYRHNIKRAIIELHSPGGALFEAQRIVGIIRYWQSNGVVVETRLFGAAFSAGFYVFVAGDVRMVDRYSDLMWHELQSFEGFGLNVSTPSDKEEAAKVLRHLQDVRNEYLATRGELSKKEIDEKISKKEFWMSGEEAIGFGFADGFITSIK